MRILILSLLGALGAHTHSISYRNNLLSYAPARGEFPVQGEVAQGYLRYLDNTGAERLVGFNYPEPLYGKRSDQVISSNKLEAQQQHLTLFRAWCEQRYNALRIELDRLRAEGKQPSANILAQIEPLEKIIKTNAFEPLAALSPEVQRAHEEHLRIWNESRLQVLQAELAQGGLPESVDQRISDEAVQLKTSQFQSPPQPAKFPQAKVELKQTIGNIAPQLYVALESPKPVQETEEVMRAREEHLRRYNEALQAQLKTPAQVPILEFSIQPQQTPQPVEETPEVKRAREEHLKQYNEEILRQSAQTPQQPLAPLPTAALDTKNLPYAPLPMAIKQTKPIAPLPEVKIKSSIPIPIPIPVPLKQNIHEQQIELLNQSKLKAEDNVADIQDRIRLEERERERELLREKELRREEQKQAELEREREQLRLLEEQKLLEAERISLQQQEQQRIESERLQESKRLQPEQQISFSTIENTPAQPNNNYKLIAPTPVNLPAQPDNTYKIIAPPPAKPEPQIQTQPQAISQQQQVQNGFFLRIQAGQPNAEPIPEGIAQNPFLTKYIQQPQQLEQLQQTQQSQQTLLKASPSIASSYISSSNLVSTGLSELEIANREHFRAHEMALEQLRLASLKNPEAIPTPCQHEH